MTGFDATPIELQVCGSTLSQIKHEIHEQLGALKSEVESLMTDGWQGGAADGFGQGWEQWHAGATEVFAALETTGELLSKTGQNYDKIDEHSAGTMWQSGADL